jgi:hypothetical protein
LPEVRKRIFEKPGFWFTLVLLWKTLLLVLTSQPIPSNDAFFYDGPVVNLILHGKYANPSLILALPISGGEVFCAYPPLYQLALLGWLALFGVSAVASMFFHLFLFAVYLWVLLKIFEQLDLAGWAAATASAFLFVITFHDRPDSLAHVFGILAVYCWIRSRASLRAQFRNPPEDNSVPFPISWRGCQQGWTWTAVLLVILALATGLQIGALYFSFIWVGMILVTLIQKEKFPLFPMLMLALIPIGLLALVIFGFPHLWRGFLEHAHQTPSLTGWRLPRFSDILKTVRTVPGILVVVALMPRWVRERKRVEVAGKTGLWIVALTAAISTSAVIVASLLVLTPNSIFFASYLQPLVVGCFLGMIPCLIHSPEEQIPVEEANLSLSSVLQKTTGAPLRLACMAFLALGAIGSIRAIGMSTWGVTCATDSGYGSAVRLVGSELDSCARQSAAVLSSAYLYEAVRHNNIRAFHSDWLAPARRGEPNNDLQSLIALKPCKVILTQFDYYRRFETVFSELKTRPEINRFEILNTAKVPAPDSFPSLQKIVQHICWAPVIVSLSWK